MATKPNQDDGVRSGGAAPAVSAQAALPPLPQATSRLEQWVPGLLVARNYQRAWLPHDLSAGLALTALLVPVGMGYAQVAGLPPVYGLYATMIPLIVYAITGPSRILVVGPDSALAGMIAATVLPLAVGRPDQVPSLAAMLGLLAGAFCVIGGLARLGFVTDLLSKPIRYGYLNGIALTVLVGQLPKLFGFSFPAVSFIPDTVGFLRGVAAGKTNPAALAIGLACLAMILGMKRWVPKVPGVLVAVVAATAVSAATDLATRAGVPVVGPLPQGLPSLTFPAVLWSDMKPLAAGAIAIALVAFAETSVLSRVYAMRGGYRADTNRELIALGAADLATGLFQGFPISSSATRTPVAESAGAKSQLTGVVGAIAIGLLLVFLPSLLQALPTAALAAVVISALLALVELPGMVRIYRLRRTEFVISLICFLGVVLFGIIEGVFLAVGVALLNLVWQAWRPHFAVLGRVQGLKGYHDISRHPEARRIPGLVLFRWDAPLFFANAEAFRDDVLRAVAEAPDRTRWVVVTAEPVTDVDITAADVLADLHDELTVKGVELCFAEMKGPVKDRLKRYGLFAQVGPDRFFTTIGAAVDGYLTETGVKWLDWEDAAGGDWGRVERGVPRSV
jgi:high affinity sulfate transporter 1